MSLPEEGFEVVGSFIEISEEIQESAGRLYSGLFQEIRTPPPHWGYFAAISIPNVSFGRLTIPPEIRVHVPWLACA